MSMTLQDAEYEESLERLYEEHSEQAIKEFTAELLQSYYFNNGLLAKPAFDALAEARNLTGTSISAAFIFSSVAMEVGIKETLLKPIVYGLVHDKSVASLVTDLAISNISMDKYKNLLLEILRKHAGVDLLSYKRPGLTKNMWEEINTIRRKRNLILHTGQVAAEEDTSLALDVAATVVETLFPSIITNMGLHLHDGYRICADPKCQYMGTPFEKLIQGR